MIVEFADRRIVMSLLVGGFIVGGYSIRTGKK